MKNDHIPLLSYVFIGITSLVLTYATIADTTGEIINPSPNTSTSTADSTSKPLFSMSGSVDKLKSMVMGADSTQPAKNVQIPPTSTADSTSKPLFSMSGSVDKLKSMVMGADTTQPDLNVPIATPVQSPIEKPTIGGKTKNKNRKRKHKGSNRKKNK